ncbi:hypothetical protein C8R47DRAFT_1224857 [Mycena vitilis]|nr:hypothetical protein C8R47DRAFT_1224857 [Mycena vitilis]
MATRRPRGKKTAKEILADRGHTNEDLNNVVLDLHDRRHLKFIAEPTLDAHSQIRSSFEAYLQRLRQGSFPNHDLTTLLKLGSPCPPLALLKGWLDHEAQIGVGLIRDTISVLTMGNKIGHFLGMYTRAVGTPIPKAISVELIAYARGECAIKYDLTTEQRVRPIADGVDVRILLLSLWSTADPIISTRLRFQLAAFILLAAYTVSRPGAIVESSAYVGSGDALKWKGIEFLVIPPGDVPDVSDSESLVIPLGDVPHVSDSESPESGTTARLAVKVTLDLLKGKRKDKSQFLSILIVQENSCQIGMCLVTLLIILAVQDRIFRDFTTLEQLEAALRSATKAYTLVIKKEALDTPILRAVDQHSREVSPTAPWRYSHMLLQLSSLGLRTGLQDKLLPGALRRGGANVMDSELSEEQRKQHMGHNTGSKIFSAYLSRLSMTDVQGLVQGRAQSLETVRAVGRMTLNRDVDAPIALSPDRRQEVLKEPEVQVALQQQAAAKEQCISCYGSVQAAADTEQGKTYAALSRQAKAVFRRFENHHFTLQRKEWFSNRDADLFKDKTSGPSISALPEDEDSPVDIAERIIALKAVDFNDLSADQFLDLTRPDELLLALADEADLDVRGSTASTKPPLPPRPAQTVVQHVPSMYDARTDYPPDLCSKLFGGLENASQFDGIMLLARLPSLKHLPRTVFHGTYYPEEAPTDDMRCPFNTTHDLRSETASNRTLHLHNCAREQRQARADAQSRVLYPLQDGVCAMAPAQG